MPEYRATLTMEIRINAPNKDAATNALTHFATMPTGCTLMDPIEADIREMRPLDKRLVARLPNLPRVRVEALVSDMTECQRLVLALCSEPQWGHTVFTALHKVWPLVPLETFVRDIGVLRNEGWIHTAGYSVERDVFPNLGVRAQWSQPTIKAERARAI